MFYSAALIPDYRFMAAVSTRFPETGESLTGREAAKATDSEPIH